LSNLPKKQNQDKETRRWSQKQSISHNAIGDTSETSTTRPRKQQRFFHIAISTKSLLYWDIPNKAYGTTNWTANTKQLEVPQNCFYINDPTGGQCWGWGGGKRPQGQKFAKKKRKFSKLVNNKHTLKKCDKVHNFTGGTKCIWEKKKKGKKKTAT